MARGKKTGGGSRKGKQNKSTLEIKKIVQSSADFKKLTKRMYEFAMGVQVQKSMPDGSKAIYDELPNVPAAKLLFEYGFGKPKEVVELELGSNSAEIVSGFAKMVQASGAGSAT
jgi:hypothetical protein